MERLRGAILVAAVGLAVALAWITSAFAARSLTAMDPVDGKQVAGAGIGSFKLLPAGSALPSPTDCASATVRCETAERAMRFVDHGPRSRTSRSVTVTVQVEG